MEKQGNTHMNAGTSLRGAAWLAGIGLLLMTVLAPVAQFGFLQNQIAAATTSGSFTGIAATAGQFRAGVLLLLIVAILDVVVAWALYLLFKPVNGGLSLLAAWFRVSYAAMFAIGLTGLLSVLNLPNFVDGESSITGIMLVSSFQNTWQIALVFFGIHLVLIGVLGFRSTEVPNWLSILLLIAGLGYMVDSIGKLFITGYSLSISSFTFIGEVLLIFWLFWKAIKGFHKEPAN